MAIMVNGVPCCECGCGQSVGVWSHTDRWAGRVGGEPKKRIQFHRKNLIPRRDLNARRVREYRPMVERVIGRPLPATAVIHHVNEDRTDNRNENLVVCENDKYHKLLHQRLRAYRACGHADWLKCRFCKQYDSPSKMSHNKANRSNYHPHCATKYVGERRRLKLLAKREQGKESVRDD